MQSLAIFHRPRTARQSFVGVRRTPLALLVAATVALAGLTGCSRGPQPAEVVISLDKAMQPLTAATVTVDYSQASAKPQIRGGDPACAALPPDMQAEFSDNGNGQLTIGLSARRGFSAPIDLAVCRMIPDSPEIAAATISSRIRVTLSAATDTKGEQLNDRRLAATRSGGRDVSESPRYESSGADGSRAVAGGGGGSTDGVRGKPGSGTGGGTGSSSLANTMRERSTGNPEKEVQRRAERENEAMKERRRAQAAGEADDPNNDDLGGGQDGGQDGGDEENDPDVHRSTPAYDINIEVLNNAGLLGALQFDVRHTGGSGGFVGAKSGVACTWTVGGGLTACNDTGSGRLRCAVVNVGGFPTPAQVVTCAFKTSEQLSAAQFNVQVVDASDPEFNKVPVDMAVTSVILR